MTGNEILGMGPILKNLGFENFCVGPEGEARREGLHTKRGGGRASRERERRRGRAAARGHAGDIPK